MRLHRFNVVQPLGEEVVIDEVSLVNQWTKVFRYTVGDFVILFNGDGNDYCYSLLTISKYSCTLKKESVSPSIIPTKKTYLFLAIIKKDNFELVAQKATELGITDILPLITERTEKKPLDMRRLTLITKEASEQSGRGDVPTIHEPVALKEISVALLQHHISSDRTFATTLFGQPLREIFINNHSNSTPCAFLIGPEGGWTDKEETFLEENSFVRISLGNTTLRAETAGIVCSFLSTMV